jgi:uncharacterized phage-associated protein
MRKIPYDAKAIANFFLGLAEDEKIPLTPMKLQKLVYYAHGWHLGLTGHPLLNEAVQAWNFGPVIMSLYKEFADFGSGPITRKAKDVEGNPGASVFDSEFTLHEPSIDDYTPESKAFTKNLLERIWRVYSGFTAVQLSNMTHAPGTPWDQVNKRYNGNIPKYETIPEELIKQYFQVQVKSA